MGSYQDLLFCQKARQVVSAVNVLIRSWPRSMQAQEISRQLFRSATSVGANIAEGHGRHQGTEYIHYLMVARASANETEHRLNTAKDCGLGPAERIDEILGWNNETIRMIASTISTLRAGQASRKIGDSSTDYQTDTEINDV